MMPTAASRGTWSPEHVHGGPVAALLAHAIERERPSPDFRVARLTVDLLRPVPMRPLEVRSEVVRQGRRVAAVDASIRSEGVEVSRATALLLRVSSAASDRRRDPLAPEIPGPSEVPARPNAERPHAGEQSTYLSVLEVHEFPERAPGWPGGAWIRVLADFAPGEPLAPVVRAAAAADLASALPHVHRGTVSFINTDITLYLDREPVGEWIGIEVVRRSQADGIALGAATIHDVRSACGSVAAAAIATPSRPVSRV